MQDKDLCVNSSQDVEISRSGRIRKKTTKILELEKVSRKRPRTSTSQKTTHSDKLDGIEAKIDDKIDIQLESNQLVDSSLTSEFPNVPSLSNDLVSPQQKKVKEKVSKFVS